MADTYKWIGDGVVKIGPPKEEKYYGKGEIIPHEEIPGDVLEDFIRDGLVKKEEAAKPPPVTKRESDPERKQEPIQEKLKPALEKSKEKSKPKAKKSEVKVISKKPFRKGKKK